MAHLTVTVDGTPLEEGKARAIWARFSAYMEEHRGDLAGFAAQEGYAAVHPSMGPDGACLVLSSSGAQRPYASVAGAADPDAPPARDEGASSKKKRRNRGRRRGSRRE